MKTFEEYLQRAARDGPPRPGIVLGIRMALHGAGRFGLQDPKEVHDRLVVLVETDRCLPDALELVIGCRLGNRRLKLENTGKMAATFFDLPTRRAFRVAAREEANQQALRMFPHLEREEALGKAYRELSDEDLFRCQPVQVELAPEEQPGYQSSRVLCAECGEGIAFRRELLVQGRVLCRSCAGQGYYSRL